MKWIFITLSVLIFIVDSTAQPKFMVTDEYGRNMVPRGFVVITEDAKGKVQYTPDDYDRMVRMGANFQVIRLNLAELGGWEGFSLNQNYIHYVDSLVAMGREAGLKTDFKMVIYGIPDFNVKGWGKLWKNNNGEQDKWISGWKHIWERYKDDKSVFGYDLLNEPRKGDLEFDYPVVEQDYLVPFLRKMIDESQKINPEKKCLYQPLLVNDDDRKKYLVPFWEMKTPVNRKNIVYAPHIYEMTIDRIRPTIERYTREAGVSDAGMFIGEWGPATYVKNDTSLADQRRYTEVYRATASLFDQMGIGTVKAWFCGSRLQNKTLPTAHSWAIFSDDKPVGVVERKYITDVIARPYPQVIAGKINEFSFDFATRIFRLDFMTDNQKGSSVLFIPADRYYPDGFSVFMNDDLLLFHNPLKNTGPEKTVNTKSYSSANFIWDPYKQHLTILQWPDDQLQTILKIVPGY